MNSHFEGNAYVMPDYNCKPPFSGFLPGVAGVFGCPVWCLYVNRGQCVASFGEDGREAAMMEYVPAVTAYEDTARKGFRTFVDTGEFCFEPFSPYDRIQKQELVISRAFLELSTIHHASGLEIRVHYSVLPEENTGALMRRLTIKNNSTKSLHLRVADGMARVIPGGIKNSEMREMANLTKSFFETKVSSCGLALFSSRSTTDNVAAVGKIDRRHFYYSVFNGKALPVSCKPESLFGSDTGLASPERFYAGEVPDIEPGHDCIPCAFAYLEQVLEPEQELTVWSFAGFLDYDSDGMLMCKKFCDASWCQNKLRRAEQVVDELADALELKTASPVFDAYIEQCMLDNILRGGKPIFLGDKFLHVFGRRHGDLERDYNRFTLESTHFSEGDGNFRDVCQNRRNDVIFWPEVEKREIVEFLELIQLDGYNPLEIRPTLFKLMPDQVDKCAGLIGDNAGGLITELKRGLSAGQIWRRLHALGLNADDLCNHIVEMCRQVPSSAFEDGYWIDHWTYILDLVENFLKIYPERQHELLFETYIGSAPIYAKIIPFRERICMTSAGPRQYGAVHSGENGCAGKERMSVFAKLLLIAALKCASLDACQSGLEMEAGKPGWNDALNGLPGLFGSSSSECIDLRSLLARLAEWCSESVYIMPSAVASFALQLADITCKFDRCCKPSLQFWRESLKLRERWRENLYSGESDFSPVVVKSETIRNVLNTLLSLINNGLSRAGNAGGTLNTYFVNEPLFDAEAETLSEDSVTGFKRRALPLFLEGQTKLMRLCNNAEAANLCRVIDASPLFDSKLKMYRICAPLENESLELGRIRAFTPGIFERESIFLHAELKYLLAMFDAGLYSEFFERLKTALPPFFNIEVYGRSTTENCSYIVSSAYPDQDVHGRGFQPRLSGSTAEMLSLWQRMFLGQKMFYVENGELCFKPEPILAGWLFPQNGCVSFKYLGCQFVYRNLSRRNTYGVNRTHISRITSGDSEISGFVLRGKSAEKLRSTGLTKLTIEFT